jgi:hypothetical protein
MYYVYIHTLPNGKIYIGETKRPIQRWNKGDGYKTNKALYDDIVAYGWNNIKHEIIGEFEREIDARICEAILISHFDSENKNIGYNKTSMRKDSLNMYASRKAVHETDIRKSDTYDSIFESSGLPVSACNELINQWVFNEKHRSIIHDRYIDGLTYTELSKKYEMSVRQVKNIVSNGTKRIEEHI